tara:strand:+ start:147 stop:377 length:231 start_codon:yes stop_codon:yes gene_type:complete
MDYMLGLLEPTCRACGTTVQITVLGPDYDKWKHGELIQNAMPYLSADERELLISGTCGSCFDQMFGESDDDWAEND